MGIERNIEKAMKKRKAPPINATIIKVSFLCKKLPSPEIMKIKRINSRTPCPATKIGPVVQPLRGVSETVTANSGPGIIAPERAIKKEDMPIRKSFSTVIYILNFFDFLLLVKFLIT